MVNAREQNKPQPEPQKDENRDKTDDIEKSKPPRPGK
jgi:hypothetical protein